MMLKNYKTLLFDIDDTLLDFKKAEHIAFKQLLAHHNIDYTDTTFQLYLSINEPLWKDYELGKLDRATVLSSRFEQFFAHYQLSVSGKECDILYRSYLTIGNQLLDGALELIDTVSKTHQLAIVTNGVYDTQMARLKNNGLLPYFKHIFVSDKVGFQKPDKRFFDTIWQEMNITDTSSVLIIGDSLGADIKGGQNAGIDTCWINPTHQPNTLSHPITYTVDALQDLYTLF
ncbi:noncanonical pyrimidine nucleotidase, YjjG family [Carnobacteriaceae bacterium zg-84]|nr:noncanonical pyrimidine nucleotidase, YjjG family [Granulicatella sp. zg-84]QMI86620.1 noncanonical pyrimidine nucleotidase, YjjG family [Carnobacteriaceae bacterium zg-84]